MNRFMLAAALVLGLCGRASADFCEGCIQNSAVPQNAQFNITSATIRGPLYVGSINLSTITVSSMTAAVYTGSGTFLTNLNASELKFGLLPSAVVSGNYSGINGVGTIGTGVWDGSIIGSQYGGTGANLVTSGVGAIPYFGSIGVMAALPPGNATYLLQSNGSGAPSYTGVPQILGTNITGIPMANLIPGQLPTNISINDASISTVSAAKVIGDIPGRANNIYGTLSLLQLSTGTLINSIVASSVTASGVTPGIWGGPNQLIQATVGYDGRITSISQSSFTVFVGSITSGPLPPGVTIGASQITAGTLGSSVIASSLNVTGVTSGAYGAASQVASFTVRPDGRLSVAGQIPIAINTSQINSGTLPGGVLVPAASIQGGVLGNTVIASSIAANGIAPGTYGAPSNSLQITVGADGRVTSAAQFGIPGLSTNSALNNIDNGWQVPQTFLSSVTVNANLKAQNINATSFTGNGASISNLSPGFISAGTLNTNVVASSVSIPFLTVTSSVNASAFFGDGSHLTGVGGSFTGGTVANQTTFLSSITVLGAGVSVSSNVTAANITATSSSTASAFFGDVSHTTGQICGNGVGGASILCEAITGGMAGSDYSVVSGGRANLISGSNAAIASVISGGGSNSITQSDAVIAGGASNVMNSPSGSIGGGFQNSTGGGFGNVISGGNQNTTAGDYSVVPGGSTNHAIGNTSFAAGLSANADHNGSFVWADSNSTGYHSHGVDTVNLLAHGGAFVDKGSLTVSASSVTASAFFGDGSHLTNVSASFTGGTVPNETDFISSVTFHTTVTIGGVTFVGAYTSTQLRSLACAVLPCQAQSTTDFDIYTATATTTGSWRNSRIGTAP